MLSPFDHYFLQHAEPTQSCLQYLRGHILKLDSNITEAWKYGMPFFCYNGKMMCYLWVHKKLRQPYLGIVTGNLVIHPDLIIEKRAKMKILLLDPSQDLPMGKIDNILNQMLDVYRH
ncbi:DUF1801 domain-containing protein [Mucilaginibacter terrigena]|uniref:DUF1801 domain-containing protein n=1 Tax=Mucilaginibacter terrigena TaxID=2492395 RepID=A0A4V1ZBV9_9SPHI|nr:DUF1801 domain-containing protein [Mucilaginibacter terrigena]RYU90520.1 DUF1801 domain-containing protein [Mucilaginibacter terrigena]